MRALLARGAVVVFFAQAVGLVVNLVVMKRLVEVFGERYGAFLAGSALISILALLELGLALFLTREVAALSQQAWDPLRWRALFVTVGLALLAVGILVSVGGTVLAPWAAAWVAGDVPYISELRTALALTALQVGLSLPLNIVRAVVHGLQKLEVLGWLSVTNTVASSLAILGIVAMWPNLAAVPLGTLGGAVAVSVVAAYSLPATFSLRTAMRAWPRPDPDVGRAALTYCRPFLLGNVFYMVRERTDQPLAARFVGADSVVTYTCTVRLVRLLMFVLPTVSNLAFSASAVLLAAGEIARLRRAVLEAVRAAVAFGILASGAVWVINSSFVSVWVGPEWFGGEALSTVFCLWLLADCVQGLLSAIVLAAGLTHRASRYVGIEAVLNVILSIILVQYFGVIGLALGTLFSMILGSAWLLPRIVFQLTGIGLGDLWNALRGPFLLRNAAVLVGLLSIRLILAPLEDLTRLTTATFAIGLLTVAAHHRELRHGYVLILRRKKSLDP